MKPFMAACPFSAGFGCASGCCPGYLSHLPGFLNVKRAKVVTIMGYYAVLSRMMQKPDHVRNTGQNFTFEPDKDI
jgi:hypothetical protein